MACMRNARSNTAVLAVVADLAERFGAAVIRRQSEAAFFPSRDQARAIGRGVHPRFREIPRRWFDFGGRERISRGPAEPVEGSMASTNHRRTGLRVFRQRGAQRRSCRCCGRVRRSNFISSSGGGSRRSRHAHRTPDYPRSLRRRRPQARRAPSYAGTTSREAQRAIADALPLLQASKRVDVVEVVDPKFLDENRRRLDDIGAWLVRHDVNAQCRATNSSGEEAVQLAEITRDLEADLIVAGAFGHSRLREWAFGGVTREFVLQADRCVLASR